MKIQCPCGSLVSDSTDFIPYKATVIADQDREDVAAAIDASAERIGNQGLTLSDIVGDAIRPYERTIYQCTQCGRLLLHNRGDHVHSYTSFVPDDAAAATGVLRSNRVGAWRGFLRGHWGAGTLSAQGGSIWWECADGESGFEEFAAWDELQRRYDEIFKRLRTRGVLRSSFLKKDGEIVQSWPD